MNQFGSMNVVIELATDFGYKLDDVLEIAYNVVFLILYRKKVQNDIAKKLTKLLEQKAKIANKRK